MNNPTKQLQLGWLREILTLAGGLIFSMSEGHTAIIALIVATAAVVWALVDNEGLETVFTLARKALSLVPGILVHFDLIDPTKAASLTALLGPLAAILWSHFLKGSKYPPIPDLTQRVVIFMAVLAALCGPLSSCSGLGAFQPRFTPDGCIFADFEQEDGTTYSAGTCQDGRYIIRWQTPPQGKQGPTYVQLVSYEDGRTVLQYMTPTGWVEYSEKSGFLLGPIPEPAQL